jgi:phosphatidylglycerol:prolipoprotein diacylglycerol transferase
VPFLAIPFPAIDPVLVHIGPFAIRWYALAYIVGIVCGWLLLRRLVQRPGWVVDVQAIDDAVLYVTLGVILGGRIGYVLFYNSGWYFSHPLDALQVWRGGMSFHGGLIGVIVALTLFARTRKIPALELGDVAAAVAPLGLFFGRIANFINGELWGRPAPDFPYAVVFPHGGPVPRHPSQLYEAFAEGVVLLLVTVIAARRFGFRRPGLIGGIFVLGYAVARIVCEFFREPDPQLGFLFGASVEGLGGGVTMGMLLSLPMALVGAVVIWLAARGLTRPRRLAEAPSA